MRKEKHYEGPILFMDPAIKTSLYVTEQVGNTSDLHSEGAGSSLGRDTDHPDWGIS